MAEQVFSPLHGPNPDPGQQPPFEGCLRQLHKGLAAAMTFGCEPEASAAGTFTSAGWWAEF